MWSLLSLASSIAVAVLIGDAAPTPLPRLQPLFSTLETQPVKLPCAFDERVLLQANVNGHLLWLHLDTGSPSLYLGAQDARTAGLTPDPSTQYSQPVSVSIGAVQGPSVRFRILPTYGFDAYGRRVSGLIGGPFFHANIVTIDFPKQRVLFYPPGTFMPPPGAQPTPIDLPSNVPILDVLVGGVHGRFLLDTGAETSELSPGFARNVRLGVYRGQITAAGGSQGGPKVLSEAVYNAPDVVLGGVTVRGAQFAIADPPRVPEDGIIGRNILSHFSITLDYANFTAYFVPESP
jgi:predicted aspartyl protease